MTDDKALWVIHLRMEHHWSMRRISRHLGISEAVVREILDYYEARHG